MLTTSVSVAPFFPLVCTGMLNSVHCIQAYNAYLYCYLYMKHVQIIEKVTLHYIISQRRLHLKWPVVHQLSHICHS